MQAGEVTGPIKSGSGMYLIRVEEKVLPPLADVRGDIVQAIRQNHLNEFMNALQNRFQPVVKNPDFFSRPGAALGVQK
jgi:parvulin-like peptidyl-prolyl isomerase